jgi:hypothetical protein
VARSVTCGSFLGGQSVMVTSCCHWDRGAAAPGNAYQDAPEEVLLCRSLSLCRIPSRYDAMSLGLVPFLKLCLPLCRLLRPFF